MASNRRTYIAIESFSCQLADEDGKETVYDVFKNVTRVRSGHPLLQKNPQYFRPVDDHVHYDVEEAGGGDPTIKREAQLNEPIIEVPEATDGALFAASQAGLDLSTVKGSGVNGRITKADVDAAIAAGVGA